MKFLSLIAHLVFKFLLFQEWKNMKCIFIFHQMNVDVHPFLVIYTKKFNYIYNKEVNFYNINGFGLRKITLCTAFIISPTIIVRPTFDWVILDLDQWNNSFHDLYSNIGLSCIRMCKTIQNYLILFFLPKWIQNCTQGKDWLYIPPTIISVHILVHIVSLL